MAGEANFVLQRGASFRQDALTKGSSGFNINRIVHENEGLKRSVGARPLDGAGFAAGGVEGDEGGVGNRAAPIDIKSAAIVFDAFALFPFSGALEG